MLAALAGCTIELPPVAGQPEGDAGAQGDAFGAPPTRERGPPPPPPPPPPMPDAAGLPDPDAARQMPPPGPPPVPDLGLPPDAAAPCPDGQIRDVAGECVVARWVFEAEGADMRHETGEPAPDGWRGRQGWHRGDLHLLAGPFVAGIPAGRYQAVYYLRWARQGSGNDERRVAALAVNDFDGCDGQGMYFCPLSVVHEVRRRAFDREHELQAITVPFLHEAETHRLEFRVLWDGIDELFVDRVEVRPL